MIIDDLMRLFRRKPKPERKPVMADYRVFWWGIADNVDRATPRGLL